VDSWSNLFDVFLLLRRMTMKMKRMMVELNGIEEYYQLLLLH
jgi:hypothetical protein